jgi:hypothetical protein
VLLGVLVELGFALFAAEGDGDFGIGGGFGLGGLAADGAFLVGWFLGAADVLLDGFESLTALLECIRFTHQPVSP